MVDIAENIIQQFSKVLEDSEWIANINVLTVNTIMDDFENFPSLKSYMENEETLNYMQLLVDATKFKQDCYYSLLNEDNTDLSCVLYNANNIKMHSDTMGMCFYMI